jgi:hypothetical protein
VRVLQRALFAATFFALLLTSSALAQPSGEASSFAFLRLEPSARAAALGGSFGAHLEADVNGLFYNPALLNDEMDGALALSYLNHLAGLDAGFAAYGRRVDRLDATLAVGLRYLSYGEMDGYDEFGAETGTFSASDVALTLGAGRALSEQMHVGASVHLIHSSIDTFDASALAADLGVTYTVPAQRLTVSASLHNLGGTLSDFGELEEDLPLDLRVALTKRLRYVPLQLSVTAYNLNDPAGLDAGTAADDVLGHLALGAELRPGSTFSLRAGYNHRRHEALKSGGRLDMAGFTAGVGLKVSRVRVDYAYASWSSFGKLHQFTLSTKV